MKKIVFYCTLILGGIIGLSNMITGIVNAEEAIYGIFFFVFIIFIIWGIAGSLIEIRKLEK